MSKYIDADELIKTLNREGVPFNEDVNYFILHAPAADATEVKHGRWIKEPNCYYRCSVCGDHHPCIKGNMDYNYCPRCGANMDGDVV